MNFASTYNHAEGDMVVYMKDAFHPYGECNEMKDGETIRVVYATEDSVFVIREGARDVIGWNFHPCEFKRVMEINSVNIPAFLD